MKGNQVKRGIKRIITAVITFCLIIFILLSFVAVVKTTLADDPSLLGYRFFYIITGSMEPEIPISAAVITKRQSVYKVGDVITFRSSDPLIFGSPNTHRIVAVLGTEDAPIYQTKGDANNLPDNELVPFTDVYGKVVLITSPLNNIGSFLEFLLTPTGFFVLLVIPMLLITVGSMREFSKNWRTAALEAAHKQSNSIAVSREEPERPVCEVRCTVTEMDELSPEMNATDNGIPESSEQAQIPNETNAQSMISNDNEKGSGDLS